jgi:hypothetical protein
MTFNEYTSLRVTARFRSGKQPISPTTVHYKLINLTTNRTIIDWTEASPSADMQIDLDAQYIVADSRHPIEEQQITIAGDKGTDDQVTQVWSWKIRNLRAFS